MGSSLKPVTVFPLKGTEHTPQAGPILHSSPDVIIVFYSHLRFPYFGLSLLLGVFHDPTPTQKPSFRTMAPSAIDHSDHNGNGTATQAVTASSTNLNSYDHVTWWVGNAKQAASYYGSVDTAWLSLGLFANLALSSRPHGIYLFGIPRGRSIWSIYALSHASLELQCRGSDTLQ